MNINAPVWSSQWVSVVQMSYCDIFLLVLCQYSSFVSLLTVLHIVIFDLWITCLFALIAKVRVVTVDKDVDNSSGWCG